MPSQYQMKVLYFLLLTLFCLTNCETKKRDLVLQKTSDTLQGKKDSIVIRHKTEEDLNKEIPTIKISEKDSVNAKLKLLLSGEKKYVSLNESKLFMAYYPTLNKLYFLNEIKKGITLQSETNIEISELYYKDRSAAQKVFENIKKQLTNKDNEYEKGNYFYDYFMRGTVYILEKNKIMAIIYHPSVYPKNDKIVESFLKNNSNSFDAVIRTFMMGSFDTFK